MDNKVWWKFAEGRRQRNNIRDDDRVCIGLQSITKGYTTSGIYEKQKVNLMIENGNCESEISSRWKIFCFKIFCVTISTFSIIYSYEKIIPKIKQVISIYTFIFSNQYFQSILMGGCINFELQMSPRLKIFYLKIFCPTVSTNLYKMAFSKMRQA